MKHVFIKGFLLSLGEDGAVGPRQHRGAREEVVLRRVAARLEAQALTVLQGHELTPRWRFTVDSLTAELLATCILHVILCFWV